MVIEMILFLVLANARRLERALATRVAVLARVTTPLGLRWAATRDRRGALGSSGRRRGRRRRSRKQGGRTVAPPTHPLAQELLNVALWEAGAYKQLLGKKPGLGSCDISSIKVKCQLKCPGLKQDEQRYSGILGFPERCRINVSSQGGANLICQTSRKWRNGCSFLQARPDVRRLFVPRSWATGASTQMVFLRFLHTCDLPRTFSVPGG